MDAASRNSASDSLQSYSSNRVAIGTHRKPGMSVNFVKTDKASVYSKSNSVSTDQAENNFKLTEKVNDSAQERLPTRDRLPSKISNIRKTLTGGNVKAFDKNSLQKLKNNLENQINNLENKVFINADEKEELKRLKTLRESIKSDPKAITNDIARYSSNKMYKHMGDLRFLSILVQVRENTNNSEVTKYGLSDLEMVAVYGFSTGDYKEINSGLRAAKDGKIPDTGLSVYADYAIAGMNKIPDVSSDIPLHRAIFSEPKPGWIKETFVKGESYKDYGFMSATAKLEMPGALHLQFTYDSGAKTHAKDIGPFSAWKDEKEIVIMPKVEFITQYVGNGQVMLAGLND